MSKIKKGEWARAGQRRGQNRRRMSAEEVYWECEGVVMYSIWQEVDVRNGQGR
jgi:hypothetical protein